MEAVMKRMIACAVLILTALDPSDASARCASFTGSTMDLGGIPKAQWRTDYPASAGTPSVPWEAIRFSAEPKKYMLTVLEWRSSPCST